MATGEQPPAGDGPGGIHGGVHIGTAQGAISIGNHNTVISQPGAQPPRDPAQEHLLKAVQELRQDLGRLVTTPQTEELAAQLDATADDIQSTGRADEGRLTRLRTALQDAATAVGLLASGAAVGQAVAALLGG
ncbi:hypothetical protein AB0K80_00975 [Streptomyces sp. NPDC052682]|uniref:hypothetical protein n=1 Tax=Streptomyces sp. NPDC052682 TaxID=3154954 RepID=UPI0034268091